MDECPAEEEQVLSFVESTCVSGAWLRGKDYEESHPNKSLQGEAIATLSVLASADSIWLFSCRAVRFLFLILDDILIS
jgi:hypothetical protein